MSILKFICRNFLLIVYGLFLVESAAHYISIIWLDQSHHAHLTPTRPAQRSSR